VQLINAPDSEQFRSDYRASRSGIEEPDYRHRPLRPRRERPRRRRAAEHSDEIAPSHHSITWSVRKRNASGHDHM